LLATSAHTKSTAVDTEPPATDAESPVAGFLKELFLVASGQTESTEADIESPAAPAAVSPVSDTKSPSAESDSPAAKDTNPESQTAKNDKVVDSSSRDTTKDQVIKDEFNKVEDAMDALEDTLGQMDDSENKVKMENDMGQVRKRLDKLEDEENVDADVDSLDSLEEENVEEEDEELEVTSKDASTSKKVQNDPARRKRRRRSAAAGGRRRRRSRTGTTLKYTCNPEGAPVVDKGPDTVKGCDFDKGTCKFHLAKFWCLKTTTSSPQTGPDMDVRGAGLFRKNRFRFGSFAYFEASIPAKPGEESAMTSSTFSPTTSCMKFSYYMYGISMGTLSVHKVVNGAREATALWTVSGNQGQVWKEMQVTVTSGTNFQVAFVAKKGTSWQSDMAIDEITFTPGACTATQRDSPVENHYAQLLQDAEEKIKASELAIEMAAEAAKRESE